VLVTGEVGSWVPIPGWSGRYRHRERGWIGYRKVVMAGATLPGETPSIPGGDPEAIVPYACNKKVAGTTCGKPAVQVERRLGRKHRCDEHREAPRR
jgi:hypothetical protein